MAVGFATIPSFGDTPEGLIARSADLTKTAEEYRQIYSKEGEPFFKTLQLLRECSPKLGVSDLDAWLKKPFVLPPNSEIEKKEGHDQISIGYNIILEGCSRFPE